MPRSNESSLNTSETLAKRYADRIMQAASGELTEGQAQTLFIACTRLLLLARDVENSSFLLLSEKQSGTKQYDVDFQARAIGELTQLKEQLIFIGQIIKGEVAA